MPRRKLRLIPERANKDVNCFAFFRTKSGRPCCNALTDVYCLKEYTPCAFFATPLDAKRAAAKAKSPNGKH
jgi:hypothetical protein